MQEGCQVESSLKHTQSKGGLGGLFPKSLEGKKKTNSGMGFDHGSLSLQGIRFLDQLALAERAVIYQCRLRLS